MQKAQCWLGFAMILVVGWTTFSFNTPLLVLFVLISLVLTILYHQKVSKTFKPGALLARVNWVGIESLHFDTKNKFFPWSIISDVSIREEEHGDFLELMLKPVSKKPYRRSVLTWVHEGKPCLALAAMEVRDRTLLLGKVRDQINRHRYKGF